MKKNRKSMLLSFFLLPYFLCNIMEGMVSFEDFDHYQFCLSRETVADRIRVFLEKDKEIRNFYDLREEMLIVGDLSSDRIDYALYFSLTDQEKEKRCRVSGLYGKKIAIDPGHFGPPYSELEERIVKIPAEESKIGEDIFIAEGELTYITAIYLKELLESAGAIVFLTRDKVGKGAIEEGFFPYLSKRPKLWGSKDPLSKLFRRYYNREDLYCRAKKINDFAPDITVIIHYNVDLTEEEKKRGAFLTQRNYTLSFVPGAFCAHELSRVEDRYEFLRLLVTEDISKSLQLSKCLLTQFTKQLSVPLLAEGKMPSFVDKFCLQQGSGIFSRNLALTRLVHGPLCYAETLIQNSEEEYLPLFVKEKRIHEIAQAYFQGIRDYFNSK